MPSRMIAVQASSEIGMGIANSGWYGYSPVWKGRNGAFTTVEKGPGITSNDSEVLVSQDAFHWESVYSFKKDWYKNRFSSLNMGD